MRLLYQFLFCAWVVLSAAACHAQQSWPEYRGVDGAGQVAAGVIPADFSKSKIQWKVPVPGRAWSSPVIWGKQVWVTTATRDGKKMSALCFDLQTGEQIHDILIHTNKTVQECHNANTYASSTPAIEQGRVYVHFGRYGTSCVDTDTGEIRWQRTDILCDHFRGPASSPILSDKLVMFAMDGIDQQFVTALDKETGDTVWTTPRNIDYGTDKGDFKKAYGTGTLVDVDGERLLILPSAVATIAYNITNGKPRWTIRHGGMNASARPQKTGFGTVLITNGMGKLVSVAVDGQGDTTDTHVRYTRSKVVAVKSTLVIVNNLAFMVDDKGVASCFDTKTGQEKWAKRLAGKCAASLVTDGEKVLSLRESGAIHVFAASDQFKLLSTTKKFADGFHASPAAINGTLILRSKTHLFCIQGNQN